MGGKKIIWKSAIPQGFTENCNAIPNFLKVPNDFLRALATCYVTCKLLKCECCRCKKRIYFAYENVHVMVFSVRRCRDSEVLLYGFRGWALAMSMKNPLTMKGSWARSRKVFVFVIHVISFDQRMRCFDSSDVSYFFAWRHCRCRKWTFWKKAQENATTLGLVPNYSNNKVGKRCQESSFSILYFYFVVAAIATS